MTAALPPPPQTYTHPTPLTTLAPHLLHHLPTSLPLLRRLQFHTSSPSARIIATFPPSSSSSSSSPLPQPTQFAAIWADRTRAPETECWIFSTYESLPSLSTPTSASTRQEEEAAAAKAQCLALLAAVARLPAPTTTPLVVVGSVNEVLLRLIIGGSSEQEQEEEEEEVEGLGLEGLVAQSVVSRDLGEGGDDDDDDDGSGGRGGRGGRRRVIRSVSVPYCKWLIAPPPAPPPAPSPAPPAERAEEEEEEEEEARKSRQDDTDTNTNTGSSSPPLPPGYTFSTIPTGPDLRLTISRTQIPKTETTLAQLGNCCVRYTCPSSPPSSHPSSTSPPPPSAQPQPRTPAPTTTTTTTNLVAWAFLGPDGSLTSLHVEPAHRGRGLAQAVARRLLRSLADDEAGMGFRPVVLGPLNVIDMNNDDDDDNPDRSRGVSKQKNRNTDENGDGAAGLTGWAHSDVAAGNAESAGVARGLGGTEGWRVRWVGVDLRAVGWTGI